MTEKLNTLDRRLVDICIGSSILGVTLSAVGSFYVNNANLILNDKQVLALGLFSALPTIVGSVPVMYNHFKKDRAREYEIIEPIKESEEIELAKAG